MAQLSLLPIVLLMWISSGSTMRPQAERPTCTEPEISQYPKDWELTFEACGGVVFNLMKNPDDFLYEFREACKDKHCLCGGQKTSLLYQQTCDGYTTFGLCPPDCELLD